VAGFADAAAAVGFGVVGPADAEPITSPASGGEFAGGDPVVDDTDAAAEAAGGVGDADLSVGVGRWCGDAVGVADPLDGGDVEGVPVAGGQPGGVELVGHIPGVGGGTELADQLDCW
jgi:hypothetical protein